MIKIEKLQKRFGPIKALKGIDMVFRKGKVTAVAGPNGSGKTTMIKSILGLVKPDGGHIAFDGTKLNGHYDYRKAIGYMPQVGHFPDNLRVSEVLTLVRRIRGFKNSVQTNLMEKFHLDREMDKKAFALSGGTRQKLNAVIAFMFDPRLLILDEPTAGLDPLASSILKKEIISQRESGTTVIIATHIISEIEQLADDIVFLCDGEIHFSGPVEKLKEQTGRSDIERALAALMGDQS